MMGGDFVFQVSFVSFKYFESWKGYNSTHQDQTRHRRSRTFPRGPHLSCSSGQTLCVGVFCGSSPLECLKGNETEKWGRIRDVALASGKAGKMHLGSREKSRERL